MELDLGAHAMLVRESLAIASAPSARSLVETLKHGEPIPPVVRYPQTGVSVATRHQYTPGQLVRLLAEHGFDVVGLAPVHYHGVSPRFAQSRPEVHAFLADVVQNYALDGLALVPFASSFMMHAVRTR